MENLPAGEQSIFSAITQDTGGIPEGGVFHDYGYPSFGIESRFRSAINAMHEEAEQRKNAETLLETVKEQLRRNEAKLTTEMRSRQTLEAKYQNLKNDMLQLQQKLGEAEDSKKNVEIRLRFMEMSSEAKIKTYEDRLAFLQKIIDWHKAAMQNAELASSIQSSAEARNAELSRLAEEMAIIRRELADEEDYYKNRREPLIAENNKLRLKIDELRNKVALGEDALQHASLRFTTQSGKMDADIVALEESLKSKTADNNKLEAEVKRLNTALAVLGKAKGDSEQMERESSGKLQLAQKSLEISQRELDSINSELARARDENKMINKKLADLQDETRAVRGKYLYEKTTLSERTNQLDRCKEQLEEVQEALKTEKEKNRELSNKVAAFPIEIEGLNERLKAGLQDNQTLVERITELARENSLLRAAEHDQILLLESVNVNNRQTKETLKRTCETLTKENDRMAAELKRLDQVILANQKYLLENAELNKDLTILKASLEVATQTRDRIEDENVNLNNEIDLLKRKLEDAFRKHDNAERKLVEAAEKAAVVENRNILRFSDLRDARATEVAKFQEQISLLRADIAQLEAELGCEKEQTQSLLHSMGEKDEEAHRKSNKITDLIQESMELTLHLAEVTTKEQCNAKEISELKAKLDEANATNDSSVKEVWKLRQDKAKFTAKLCQAKKYVGRLREQLAQLHENYSSANTSIENLEKTNANHVQELSVVKTELQKKSDQMALANKHWIKKVNEMSSSIESLKAKMEAASAELEKERTARMQLENINSHLDRSLQERNDKLRELWEVNVQVEKSLHEHTICKEKLHRLRQEHRKLQQAFQSVEENKGKLERLCESEMRKREVCEREVDQLRQKHFDAFSYSMSGMGYSTRFHDSLRLTAIPNYEFFHDRARNAASVMQSTQTDVINANA